MSKFVYKCFFPLIYISRNLREEINDILEHADEELKFHSIDREQRRRESMGLVGWLASLMSANIDREGGGWLC